MSSESTILAIVPKATATISILASVYGIKVILNTPQRQAVRCNRLFMAMFIHDILRCLTYVAGTWLIPANTEGVFMAKGNNVTCASQAFLSQLGYAVPLYSTSISFYLYTEIKNDFKKSEIRWAEKWCHFFPNVLSIVLSVLLMFSGQYGADDTRCWIAPTDHRCIWDRSYYERGDSNCYEERQYLSYEWFLVFIFTVKITVITLCLISSIILFLMGCRLEAHKRRRNGNLAVGKRQIYEDARKRKSKVILTQMGSNLFVFIMAFGFCYIQQMFMDKAYCTLLISTIMTTMFGLASVVIFLKVKLPNNSSFFSINGDVQVNPDSFSLRKSALCTNSFRLLTGGYTPQPKIILEDDGGIYMGNDDEEDEDEETCSKEDGITVMVRYDQMTSFSTKSIDSNAHKFAKKESYENVE